MVQIGRYAHVVGMAEREPAHETLRALDSILASTDDGWIVRRELTILLMLPSVVSNNVQWPAHGQAVPYFEIRSNT